MEANNKRKHTETITQNISLKKQKLDDYYFQSTIYLNFSTKPTLSFIIDLPKLYFTQDNTSDIYNDICNALPGKELIDVNDMCIDSVEYIGDDSVILNITCFSV